MPTLGIVLAHEFHFYSHATGKVLSYRGQNERSVYVYLWCTFYFNAMQKWFFSNLFPEDMHAYGMGVVGTLTGGRLGWYFVMSCNSNNKTLVCVCVCVVWHPSKIVEKWFLLLSFSRLKNNIFEKKNFFNLQACSL